MTQNEHLSKEEAAMSAILDRLDRLEKRFDEIKTGLSSHSEAISKAALQGQINESSIAILQKKIEAIEANQKGN